MSLDFLAYVRSESDLFLAALDRVDGDAAVPNCPDWNADDLLWHLGEVQHFWAAIVGQRLQEIDTYERPERPQSHSALRDFFVEINAGLVAALDGARETDSVWTWFEPAQHVGFVLRRQAQEALIHRIDAELCAGGAHAGPIDGPLAADGVSEIFECMLGGLPTWATLKEQGPTGRLVSTDPKQTWTVRVDTWSGTSPDTGTVYTSEGTITVLSEQSATAAWSAPQFSIAGSAAELDTWLWGRTTIDKLDVVGDIGPFDAVRSIGIE